MSRYKNLISNTLILGAGTFASKVIVLFMMPLYTLWLSPEEFGIADIVSQTANMIIPVACIGICEGIFRFTLDGDRRETVFSTGICTLAVGTAVTFAVLPVLTLFEVLDGYVLLIGAYVACANIHSACAQYIRAQGKTTLFALQGIINTALIVVLNIFFLSVFSLGSLGYVLSVIIGDLTVTVIIVLVSKLYRDFSVKRFDKAVFSEMLRYSLPCVPSTMLWLITSVSDRYIVNYYCDMSATGLYAASYKIPTLLTLVGTVFIEAWQFSAVKDATEEERSTFFGNVYKFYLSFVFLAASLLIGGAKIFTDILLADSYYDSWEFVPVLVAATVFSVLTSFMGSVYFLEKKSVLSMLTAMAAALINIVLNFIMIPTHGAFGAAVATLVSYLAVFVIRAIDTRSFVKFKLHMPLFLANCAIIAVQIAFSYYDSFYANIIQGVFVLLIIALNIKGIFEMLRELLAILPKRKKKNN